MTVGCSYEDGTFRLSNLCRGPLWPMSKPLVKPSISLDSCQDNVFKILQKSAVIMGWGGHPQCGCGPRQ